MWSMHETAGVLRGPAHPGLHRSDSVVLSGGYGGLLRNSYGGSLQGVPSNGFNDQSLTAAMLGAQAVGSESSAPLLSANLLEQATTIIGDRAKTHKENGIPLNAIPEYLWFSFRSRYYVGEISRSLSSYVNRFDPLYTPALLPFAWNYNREERGSNFAHLDLLISINKNMALMPYDKPRVGEEYLSLNPDISTMELPQKHANIVDEYISPNAYTPRGSTVTITENQYSLARKIGLPPATVAYSETYRAKTKELIGAIGESTLSQAFNYQQLSGLVNSQPKWRPQFRALRDLHDTLLWYTS
jgi:hypothetical protein